MRVRHREMPGSIEDRRRAGKRLMRFASP